MRLERAHGGRNYNMLCARYSLMGFFRVVWGPCSPSRRSEPIRTDWFTSRRKFLESLCLFFLFFSPSLSPLSPDLEKTWPAVIVSVNYADSEQPTPLEPGLESRIIMLSLFSINILLLALFFLFCLFLNAQNSMRVTAWVFFVSAGRPSWTLAKNYNMRSNGVIARSF